MTKSDIREHFRTKFWVYILIIALSAIFWSWIITLIVAPTCQQKIIIFIGDKNVSEDYIRTQAEKEEMPTILKVETNVVTSQDYFNIYFQSFSTNDCDIMILEEEQLATISPNLFYDLSAIEDFSGSLYRYYTCENKKIAVKMQNIANGESNYYLLLCANSCHLGEYNESSVDDYAIKVALRLLIGE